MEYSLLQFISLLGSVCLFLYGMKVMSEGLQKVAGDRLRNILSIMTRNRVTGVLTGIAITALIQSSSASTVMVVSFVNAGLMTLAQSMAVIFGANFGTIVTTWIISAFSFDFHISDYTIVLLAIAVPMLFMKRSNYKSIGEFLIGFSFLFMGLDMISTFVPDLQKNPEMLRFITHYASMGYLSVIIFWLFGLILTMVAQASAATFAITLIMCSQGWVSFELGCAIILGSKIGTTITPILASLSGNLAAKRTAAGTLLYNLFGSIIVLCIFYPFVSLNGQVTEMCIGSNPLDISSPEALSPADRTSIAFGLAMFPTVFNVMNLAIMIWLPKLYVKIVTRLLPDRKGSGGHDDFSLKFIGGALMGTSELNISQAQKEIAVYGKRVGRMLTMAHELVHIPTTESEYQEKFNRIEKYEEISDRMEIEIGNFLNKVAEGRLSPEGKMRIAGMLRIISEIESIADSCYNVAKTLTRKSQAKVEFTETMLEKLDAMFALIGSAMTNMLALLDEMETPEDAKIITAYNREREINNFRNTLRDANIDNINNHKYDYQQGIFYMDLVGEAEKLGDYMLNVVEGVKHQFKPQTSTL